MSLLLPIRGQIRLADQDVETAVTRLCQGLQAQSRIAAHAVVAARFEAGPGFGEAKDVLQAARGCGWEGIPLFVAHRSNEPGILQVEAHVRVKRRRRFRDVVLDPEAVPGSGGEQGSPGAVGTAATATGTAADADASTGADTGANTTTPAARDAEPGHRRSP